MHESPILSSVSCIHTPCSNDSNIAQIIRVSLFSRSIFNWKRYLTHTYCLAFRGSISLSLSTSLRRLSAHRHWGNNFTCVEHACEQNSSQGSVPNRRNRGGRQGKLLRVAQPRRRGVLFACVFNTSKVVTPVSVSHRVSVSLRGRSVPAENTVSLST